MNDYWVKFLRIFLVVFILVAVACVITYFNYKGKNQTTLSNFILFFIFLLSFLASFSCVVSVPELDVYNMQAVRTLLFTAVYSLFSCLRCCSFDFLTGFTAFQYWLIMIIPSLLLILVCRVKFGAEQFKWLLFSGRNYY